MECGRHQTGPDSDEIPRQRRTGLARDNQTDLDCGTGRAGPPFGLSPLRLSILPRFWEGWVSGTKSCHNTRTNSPVLNSPTLSQTTRKNGAPGNLRSSRNAGYEEGLGWPLRFLAFFDFLAGVEVPLHRTDDPPSHELKPRFFVLKPYIPFLHFVTTGGFLDFLLIREANFSDQLIEAWVGAQRVPTRINLDRKQN
jgi:hypothetical protein